MKRVTIYDVAKESGVSLATVSRVMNGSDIVKQATKTKVEDAIKKLGYKPNAIAQGLALQKTTTIGLIVPDLNLANASQLISGICDVAKIYDYNIYLHNITKGISNIQEIIDDVIKSRVDGVLIYCNKALESETKELDAYNIPMVVIGDRVQANSVCSAYIDYQRAVYEIVDDYLERGKKNIIVLEDRRNVNVTKEMINGAKEAFEKHGQVFNNYVEFSNDERSTYKFLKSYFRNHRHDLVIVDRDSQAMACLNAARENNIVVPDEMELICMNDTKYISMVRPEITAFEVPTYDLGAVAMRLMTKMLNNEEVEEKEKVLGYLYKERNTTK